MSEQVANFQRPDASGPQTAEIGQAKLKSVFFWRRSLHPAYGCLVADKIFVSRARRPLLVLLQLLVSQSESKSSRNMHRVFRGNCFRLTTRVVRAIRMGFS